MNDTTLNKKEIVARLIEIREACSVATSMDDINLNEVIEEINRLATACIEMMQTA